MFFEADVSFFAIGVSTWLNPTVSINFDDTAHFNSYLVP